MSIFVEQERLLAWLGAEWGEEFGKVTRYTTMNTRARGGITTMPVVTILQVAEALGVEENNGQISGGEFLKWDLPIMGGCQGCGATIAAYNAAPTTTGFLRCASDCADGYGYNTVEEAVAAMYDGKTIEQVQNDYREP